KNRSRVNSVAPANYGALAEGAPGKAESRGHVVVVGIAQSIWKTSLGRSDDGSVANCRDKRGGSVFASFFIRDDHTPARTRISAVEIRSGQGVVEEHGMNLVAHAVVQR